LADLWLICRSYEVIIETGFILKAYSETYAGKFRDFISLEQFRRYVV